MLKNPFSVQHAPYDQNNLAKSFEVCAYIAKCFQEIFLNSRSYRKITTDSRDHIGLIVTSTFSFLFVWIFFVIGFFPPS